MHMEDLFDVRKGADLFRGWILPAFLVAGSVQIGPPRVILPSPPFWTRNLIEILVFAIVLHYKHRLQAEIWIYCLCVLSSVRHVGSAYEPVARCPWTITRDGKSITFEKYLLGKEDWSGVTIIMWNFMRISVKMNITYPKSWILLSDAKKYLEITKKLYLLIHGRRQVARFAPKGKKVEKWCYFRTLYF